MARVKAIMPRWIGCAIKALHPAFNRTYFEARFSVRRGLQNLNTRISFLSMIMLNTKNAHIL